MERIDTESYWSHTRNWETLRNSYFPDDLNAKAHKRSNWACGILRQTAFTSILELGCNCGRNLYHLQKQSPEVEIAGIDINPEALEFAQDKVKGQLVCGSIYELDKVFQRRFDVVFTMAVLIHIVPQDIDFILEHILRLSTKAIVHFEYNGAGTRFQGLAKNSTYWSQNIIGFYERHNIKYRVMSIPKDVTDVGLEHAIICDLS